MVGREVQREASDLAGSRPAPPRLATRQPPHGGTTVAAEADLLRVFSLTVQVGLWAPVTL